jgi:hypothetical protein
MFAVKYQPLVVAIDATDRSFYNYTGDVYRGFYGHSLNYEMLLIGYGMRILVRACGCPPPQKKNKNKTLGPTTYSQQPN